MARLGLRQSILIVEDDPVSRRLLEFALSAAGYDARAPASCMEALGVVGANRPDIILLDVSAQELYGESFLRLAERQGWGGPVVVLSKDADWQELTRDMQAEFGFSKPVDLDALIGRITALLPAGSRPDEPPKRERAPPQACDENGRSPWLPPVRGRRHSRAGEAAKLAPFVPLPPVSSLL